MQMLISHKLDILKKLQIIKKNKLPSSHKSCQANIIVETASHGTEVELRNS